MEEVKPKVFVSTNNIYVTNAITAAGAESTKDKNDADIIVCVMHSQATAKQSDWREKEWKNFKEEVKLQFNKENNIPVVLVYTKMIGRERDGEDVEITQRLEKIGQELEIVSLTVVRNSIEFDEGKEELKKKLEQFRSAEQMSKIIAAREARKQKQEKAPSTSPRLVEQSRLPQVEVVQSPRKKVFIDSNLPVQENKVILPEQEDHNVEHDFSSSSKYARPATRKEKIATIVRSENCVVAENPDDADIVVVIWRVGPYEEQKDVTGFLHDMCAKYKDTNKKIIFAFDYGTSSTSKDIIELKDSHLDLLMKQNLPDNFHLCGRALDFQTGEIELQSLLKGAVSPVNQAFLPQAQAVIAPAPVVQHASFFTYPEKRSFCHSRQIRNNYFEDHLKINTGDDESTKRKKLFLLFAHYKSLRHTIFNVGHVDSWLSKKIEDELAKNLMKPQAYKAYTKNKDKKRTSNLGKCFDPFAKKLEELFLEKYSRAKPKENHGQLLDNLIKLLSYADRRERRSFFNGTENQTFIKNIIEAAELVYDKKIRPQVGVEVEKEPGVLPWYAQRIYDKAIVSAKTGLAAARI
ncbi:MAG: hypothetical protein SFW07_05560 [Gammaproteobacteria bacterium]|nr:hypothetical protein [Gammaproteobacteria bacterium]